MGSVGTTDRTSSLPDLPWSSKRVGSESGFDFPEDFIEAPANDDTILATEVDAQTGTTGDTSLKN